MFFLVDCVFMQAENTADSRKTLTGKKTENISGKTCFRYQKENGCNPDKQGSYIDKECSIGFSESVKDASERGGNI